ncbi:single-stranded-DNA-specific exonuclease RecJ [Siphonobacter sp. SORGH_AS_1065]|uniref:single-stranded-DNA-specific exonuclease RecJ n=1 Tax=Siphonobacter sp. SORGH_AS_1065 TaxID=3041795 RepID=UPI00278B2C5A|nr:single-stranded-DNA-specific exonuclease RecJ [Siphonobacter sp. SORGH_AS_1065]MDQ1086959.1 single-stranded-DNA-specific exonuclease [Siphonobacter sp. SORGH_AS_1065]
MVEKRWSYQKLPETSEDKQTVESLAQAINVNSFLATLLWQRNIREFDSAKSFFRPQLSELHDPMLMKDMDRAVERLTLALNRGEKILIYGDYDVDGTTSVALFYGYLKTFYDHLEFYIPDRYKEGYGVQKPGITYAAENGFTLIVTLDCGIKSVDLVAEAKNLGIDFIICDHHRPGEVIPEAEAVLDPKRVDCPYPFKELTGCGVGFKLLQAYNQYHQIPTEGLFEYLDLLAISIAADIVPITGENRILAHYGLKQLNAAPRTGLRTLIKSASLKPPLDITNVVFGISPRINAAGRIKHAYDAVNLLLCEDENEAEEFARIINTHNTDRRQFDTRITQEALTMIETDDWLKSAKSTVLFKNDWNKGVVGIVASRCIEQYYRPTIILTESNEKAAGSARSVPGFDVYEAIEACSDLLEQYGGHMYAAGLTLKVENVPAFQRRFEEVVSRKIQEEHLSPLVDVDMKLPLSAISDKFYGIISQMGPFGPENMTPVFVAEQVQLYGTPRILKEKHLKMDVRQSGSQIFSCIGFGMAHFYEKLLTGRPFDLCYQVEINEFQGKRTLQLQIKDIKFSK